MEALDVALVDEQPSSATIQHGAYAVAVDAALDSEVVIARMDFADAACGDRIVHGW